MSDQNYLVYDQNYTPAELAVALKPYPNWQIDPSSGTGLAAKFTFFDGLTLGTFVHYVLALAEVQNHHPQVIVDYRTVRVVTKTTDTNGVTERDIALIEKIEELGAAYGSASACSTGGCRI